MINFYEFKQKLEENIDEDEQAHREKTGHPHFVGLYNKIMELEKMGDIRTLNMMQQEIAKMQEYLDKSIFRFKSKGHGGYPGG